MSSKHYIGVYLFALCFILISSISHAEQRSTGNIGIIKPTVAAGKQELKPLQQTLIASQYAMPNIYQLLLLTIDNVYAAKNELQSAVGTGYLPAGIDDELRSYYKPHIKNCLAKSYSVQDQQAAGCAGTDTVNHCMDKLYKYCIGSYKGGSGNKENFIKKFKTALERSNDINAKSKNYSNQLQTLLNNMP
ncbi:MAG: hypothetical protein CVU62_09345 [Deltaproteobacteria bacterium HGW-Deltaproteobacteria-2]|jgi:hypothetical protein|nr:MAG: hypothetical protein CVU62_09345 [Deltaproteobacteria bacterium HGW-Deltaproteobacteria-2]